MFYCARGYSNPISCKFNHESHRSSRESPFQLYIACNDDLVFFHYRAMNTEMRAPNKGAEKINQREVITLFLSICDLLKEWLASAALRERHFPFFFLRWKPSQLAEGMEKWVFMSYQSTRNSSIKKSIKRWLARRILFRFINVIPLEIKKKQEEEKDKDETW